MEPHGEKRKFPYHSQVQGFQLKRQGPDVGADVGRERHDPKVYQQPSLAYEDSGVSGWVRHSRAATVGGRTVQGSVCSCGVLACWRCGRRTPATLIHA